MSAKWYIVHAYSGYEKKVAEAIGENAAQKGLSNMFEQIEVPTEEVVEMRKGKKKTIEKRFFPGYVLVKMVLDDDTWHLVKSTQYVTGFLGAKGKPTPISEGEVERIFQQAREGAKSSKNAVLFESGEPVRIIDGPFESFEGVVEEVDEERNKLKIAVSIFGRSTPVELEYTQVEKIKM